MLIVTLLTFLDGINEKTKSKIVFHDIIFFTIILILFGPALPGNALSGLVVGKTY